MELNKEGILAVCVCQNCGLHTTCNYNWLNVRDRIAYFDCENCFNKNEIHKIKEFVEVKNNKQTSK